MIKKTILIIISTAMLLAHSNHMITNVVAISCIMGDVNSDGVFDISDAEIFQKWLLSDPDATLENWKVADFYSDGRLDVFDLCLMRKELVEPQLPTIEPPTSPIITENKKIISVANISQNPELPTGCEVTALTILLNHLGFNANKLDLARNYLPKQDFYWKNGVYYGADFRTTFAGNPESEYSYGCYAPCIVITANKYLNSIGVNNTALNISGTDFDNLLGEYIDNNTPFLIWITSGNLHESSLTSVWTTPQGEKVQWRAYEHCVVLTGYDLDKELIYVSDPLYNNISYDYNKIKLRYNEMGKQAVCIK